MKRLLLPRRGLLIVCLALGAASTAWAQGGAEAPGKSGDAPKGEPASDDEERVPTTKHLERSGEWLVEMRGLLTKGIERLREAREQKDAVLLTCVNEQVTAMKGVLAVSEKAFIALQEAQAAKAAAKGALEFSTIRTSRKKMKELYQTALNCAGADATVSNTSVEVEIDPAVAEDDPYYGDPDFFYTPSDTLADGSSGELGDTEDPPYVRPPPASGTL